jgi:putative zinc finger/helix-turn-helix YgiT family protein
MKKKMYCPKCGAFQATYEEITEQTLPVRGECITVSGAVRYCSVCNEALVSEDLDAATLERAYCVFRERHGLLSPREIRAIRESYGMSQRAMARLLGWGDITLHRYENGALQDVAHDSVLRLIRDPANALALATTAADRLPAPAIESLKQRIQSRLDSERISQLRRCLERVVSYPSCDQYSGFRAFDLDKWYSVVLELSRQRDGIVKTKLNKMLWYCDFLHFRDYSVSITGSPYLHLQYGPVPAHYDMLINLMELEGLITRTERVFSAERDIVGDVLSATSDLERGPLTESERRVIRTVMSLFGDLTARQITEASHSERAYVETHEFQMIPYHYARDLSVASSSPPANA